MNLPRIPVLVLFGPTASGKTSLAGRLFSSDASSVFGPVARIISADSMQVYRGMNIGTAKPDADFLQKLPHHLIDIADPSQQFDAAQFVELADKACSEIFSRKKLPVICGGTAFYIKNFIFGLPVTPESDENVRNMLKEQAKTLGVQAMYQRLQVVDPERAAILHVNDEYRILRALEVYETTGKPLTSFMLKEEMRDLYDFYIFALERPRQELYERINLRVEQMMNDGLAEEFFSLIGQGYKQSDPGMQAIGYREFFMVQQQSGCNIKNVDLQQVAELIQSDSRKYAKKQMTFFKTVKQARWFNAQNEEEIIESIKEIISKYDFVR